MNAGIADIVKKLEKTIPCTCDLDKWEPESSTGHSWVCGIHKAAKAMEGKPEEKI